MDDNYSSVIDATDDILIPLTPRVLFFVLASTTPGTVPKTQCFITAMDALKLEQRAVDEVQPLIIDLADRLNKVREPITRSVPPPLPQYILCYFGGIQWSVRFHLGDWGPRLGHVLLSWLLYSTTRMRRSKSTADCRSLNRSLFACETAHPPNVAATTVVWGRFQSSRNIPRSKLWKVC